MARHSCVSLCLARIRRTTTDARRLVLHLLSQRVSDGEKPEKEETQITGL